MGDEVMISMSVSREVRQSGVHLKGVSCFSKFVRGQVNSVKFGIKGH